MRRFERSLMLQPQNADALKGLGYTQFMKGDYKEAIKTLRKSLALLPEQVDVMSMVAWSQYRLGDNETAIKGFEEAIAINPFLAEPYNGLAHVLYKTGKKEDALKNYGTAAGIYPSMDEEFKAALSAEEGWYDLLKYVGWRFYHTKQYAKAKEVFEIAVKKKPGDAEGLQGLGYVYYQLKDYDNAIKALEKGLSINPESLQVQEYVSFPGTSGEFLTVSDARGTLAWSLYSKNDYDKAIAEFKRVTEKHPDWCDPWDGLGWCYLRKEMLAEAKKQFTEALKIYPNYPSSLEGIAVIK